MAAGYDPKAAISFWEKMASQDQGTKPPPWLSTHPTHGNRIAQVRQMVANVTGDRSIEIASEDLDSGNGTTTTVNTDNQRSGGDYITRRL